MSNSETETQPPTPSDVAVNSNGISPSQSSVKLPSSHPNCEETSQMAPSLSADGPTSSTAIASVKIPLLIRHHSLDGGDERFPTYVIPDRKPTLIKKSSLPISYTTKNRLAEVANIHRQSVFFSPVNSQKSSLLFRRGSSCRMELDWGQDSEWIMRYDNLLESKSLPPSYHRQLNADYPGKPVCFRKFLQIMCQTSLALQELTYYLIWGYLL